MRLYRIPLQDNSNDSIHSLIKFYSIMNSEWGVSEHTSTDRALNLNREIYISNCRKIFSQTFGEEWTNKKTEGNGCHGETQQKQEDN